jgi:uncharacterized membrane protein YeaQ/YmgE (transglycosylase-associated protein family)
MTINLEVGQIIVWIIIGSIAGFLAGLVFRGRGYGAVGNLVIGLLGAIIGGFLLDLLNVQLGGRLTLVFTATDLLGAFLGALLLLFLLRVFSRR